MRVLVRIFGVLAILMGVGILVSSVYPLLIEQPAENKEGNSQILFRAAMAPIFIVVGITWLRRKYNK